MLGARPLARLIGRVREYDAVNEMEASHVFKAYWRFAAERHAMFQRRLLTAQGPWTDDAILSQYRFTNTYRVNDRVSQYLVGEIQYGADRSYSPIEVFFRTLLFKLFNRIETWKALEKKFGPLSWSSVDLTSIDKELTRRKRCGKRIYSAAYIMPAPRLGYASKHRNHLKLLSCMIEDGIPELVCRARSLRSVYELLTRYPGIGKFLGYQFAIDLNYSPILTHSENEFVVAGPGALEGISKCFADVGGRSPEEVIFQVCDNQEASFRAEGIPVPTLHGRRLHPVDCQNVFCEISKYARVAYPNVRGLSGRKRIKQIYRQNAEPLPMPVYPPRWKLNGARHFAAGRAGTTQVGLFT